MDENDWALLSSEWVGSASFVFGLPEPPKAETRGRQPMGSPPTSLSSWQRLNRVFELMNVTYDDRPVLAGGCAKGAGTSAPAKGKTSLSAGESSKQRGIREADDIKIGREIAKPVSRKSQKVSFILGDFTGDSSSDTVSPLF